MKLTELKGKKILIVGYGKEGKSVERYLHEKVPTSAVHIADKSQGSDYLDNQTDYDLAIRSPGVAKHLIKIPHTTPTNLFFGNIGKNVTIGITGSKGKSTTSALIYDILKLARLKAHLVGNIGSPLLDELSKQHSEDDLYVCELSSYQLDDINYSPHISVIVSLFPEHINYHGNHAAYYEAKKNIIKYATSQDYFVYNPQFELLQDWADTARCKSIPYITQLPLSKKEIPLLGDHNVQNVQAAVTVAKLLNIEDSIIVEAIKTFKSLPHRLEFIGKYKDISLKEVGTIFLGGENRGYDFSELAEFVMEYEIKNIVLFPNSGAEIARALDSIGLKKLNVLKTSSMEDAVNFAYKHTPKEKICLLSTASPSYSIWKNFEEKGNLFKTFVLKYQ